VAFSRTRTAKTDSKETQWIEVDSTIVFHTNSVEVISHNKPAPISIYVPVTTIIQKMTAILSDKIEKENSSTNEKN